MGAKIIRLMAIADMDVIGDAPNKK